MKKIYFLLMMVLLCCRSVYADVLVIVNADNTVKDMSKSEVTAIFMGRYQSFKNGVYALPIDQAADSNIRASFYSLLTGRNIAYINAYWARILFTGRATPPRQVPDNKDVIDLISQNPNAIGYVDSSVDPKKLKGVKIIFRLNEG